MNFYMGDMREYPSLTISKMATSVLLYGIIPLDIIIGSYYFWQKVKKSKNEAIK